MYIRCAYFEGSVAPQNQKKFDDFVLYEMVPLITKFPKIRDVKVLRDIWRENDAPPIYLSLQLTFDTKEDMEAALQSEERSASRAKSEEIIPFLDGRVYHINYAVLNSNT